MDNRPGEESFRTKAYSKECSKYDEVPYVQVYGIDKEIVKG